MLSRVLWVCRCVITVLVVIPVLFLVVIPVILVALSVLGTMVLFFVGYDSYYRRLYGTSVRSDHVEG